MISYKLSFLHATESITPTTTTTSTTTDSATGTLRNR